MPNDLFAAGVIVAALMLCSWAGAWAVNRLSLRLTGASIYETSRFAAILFVFGLSMSLFYRAAQ